MQELHSQVKQQLEKINSKHKQREDLKKREVNFEVEYFVLQISRKRDSIKGNTTSWNSKRVDLLYSQLPPREWKHNLLAETL